MSDQPADAPEVQPTVPAATTAVVSDSFKIQWTTVLVSALLSVMVSAGSIALYDRFVTPKIITIRIDQILADHIKTIATSNLNDAQKQAMSDQWSKALDKAIQQVQNGKNIVLTQNAVVDGGNDYTATVKYLINQNMNYTQANIASVAQAANAAQANREQ